MPQLGLVYDAESVRALLKGKDLVKGVLKDWTERPETFKWRAHLDYPISHFRKGVRVGMLLLNRLWEDNTNHLNWYWVALQGEIILNGRKLDFSEILAYNMHKNWEVAKLGAPIHVLFSSLYICKYCHYIIPICDYFYPMVHKAICGVDMPRIFELVKEGLIQLGAWWFFENFTAIRVEGTLTPPTRLPIHVLDILVALEVARQFNFGWPKGARMLKAVLAPPIRHRRTSSKESGWPRRHRVGKRRPRRRMSSLVSPSKELNTTLTPNVVTPLVTTPSVTFPTTTTFATTVSSTSSRSSATSSSPSSTASSPQPPGIATRAEGSHVSKDTTTVPPLNLSRGIYLSPSLLLKPGLWGTPKFTIPAPLFTAPLSTSKAIAAISIPGFGPILEESTSTSPLGSSHSTLSTLSIEEFRMTSSTELADSSYLESTTPLEVMLEYDRATNNLKKVTRRRIKRGEQVTTLQTEENLLSLTRKRRVGKGTSMDDKELVADLVSIVQSANKMFKEAVEEAKAKGEETHHPIRGSLDQIEKWEDELATLRNVARRDLLPNIPLLGLDEVVTCENVLAKTKQGFPPVHRDGVRHHPGGICRSIFETIGIHRRHTRKMSRVASRIKESVINTSQIDADYDKCQATGDKGKGKSGSSHPYPGNGPPPCHDSSLSDLKQVSLLFEKTFDWTHKDQLDRELTPLGTSINLGQVKDSTYSVSTATIHILHELAHIRRKLPPSARHHLARCPPRRTRRKRVRSRVQATMQHEMYIPSAFSKRAHRGACARSSFALPASSES
eukprot:Gb_02753 [translate_table: standard]